MASIVNARDDFGADPRRTFGQFLASFRIAHPVPEGIGLRELVQDVHAETDADQAAQAVPADDRGARPFEPDVALSVRPRAGGASSPSTIRRGAA